ncbi:hypothetical protein RI367_001862 [Sorochytrium milnesiophthora]
MGRASDNHRDSNDQSGSSHGRGKGSRKQKTPKPHGVVLRTAFFQLPGGASRRTFELLLHSKGVKYNNNNLTAEIKYHSLSGHNAHTTAMLLRNNEHLSLDAGKQTVQIVQGSIICDDQASMRLLFVEVAGQAYKDPRLGIVYPTIAVNHTLYKHLPFIILSYSIKSTSKSKLPVDHSLHSIFGGHGVIVGISYLESGPVHVYFSDMMPVKAIKQAQDTLIREWKSTYGAPPEKLSHQFPGQTAFLFPAHSSAPPAPAAKQAAQPDKNGTIPTIASSSSSASSSSAQNVPRPAAAVQSSNQTFAPSGTSWVLNLDKATIRLPQFEGDRNGGGPSAADGRQSREAQTSEKVDVWASQRSASPAFEDQQRRQRQQQRKLAETAEEEEEEENSRTRKRPGGANAPAALPSKPSGDKKKEMPRSLLHNIPPEILDVIMRFDPLTPRSRGTWLDTCSILYDSINSLPLSRCPTAVDWGGITRQDRERNAVYQRLYLGYEDGTVDAFDVLLYAPQHVQNFRHMLDTTLRGVTHDGRFQRSSSHASPHKAMRGLLAVSSKINYSLVTYGEANDYSTGQHSLFLWNGSHTPIKELKTRTPARFVSVDVSSDVIVAASSDYQVHLWRVDKLTTAKSFESAATRLQSPVIAVSVLSTDAGPSAVVIGTTHGLYTWDGTDAAPTAIRRPDGSQVLLQSKLPLCAMTADAASMTVSLVHEDGVCSVGQFDANMRWYWHTLSSRPADATTTQQRHWACVCPQMPALVMSVYPAPISEVRLWTASDQQAVLTHFGSDDGIAGARWSPCEATPYTVATIGTGAHRQWELSVSVSRIGVRFVGSGGTGKLSQAPRPIPLGNRQEQKQVDDLIKQRDESAQIGGQHPDQEKEPLQRFPDDVNPRTGERGGPKGPEPTRYGDWERKGRVYDF